MERQSLWLCSCGTTCSEELTRSTFLLYITAVLFCLMLFWTSIVFAKGPLLDLPGLWQKLLFVAEALPEEQRTFLLPFCLIKQQQDDHENHESLLCTETPSSQVSHSNPFSNP